jgi:hypothetical protein
LNLATRFRCLSVKFKYALYIREWYIFFVHRK